jgi:hypothetical protein
MIRGFFFGKNETLTQKVFELTFNALVLGMLVIFAGRWLEHRLDVYDKRKAFEKFRNAQVEETFNLLASAYSEPLVCALTSVDAFQPSCKQHLEAFRQKLEGKGLILSSMDSDFDASSLAHVSNTVQNLRHGSERNTDEAKTELIDDHRAALNAAIRDVAEEFQ